MNVSSLQRSFSNSHVNFSQSISSLFITHLYSKNVSSVLQYFHLRNLVSLILLTLSHSLFHHMFTVYLFSLFLPVLWF
jgi:hypothetical protein